MCKLASNFYRRAISLTIWALAITSAQPVVGQLKTWDGQHRIDEIEVTMVYFVPIDGVPLPD